MTQSRFQQLPPQCPAMETMSCESQVGLSNVSPTCRKGLESVNELADPHPPPWSLDGVDSVQLVSFMSADTRQSFFSCTQGRCSGAPNRLQHSQQAASVQSFLKDMKRSPNKLASEITRRREGRHGKDGHRTEPVVNSDSGASSVTSSWTFWRHLGRGKLVMSSSPFQVRGRT
mmetsp:Transcript_25886/g.48605  ORF Transcript_25886/g.48605 Transcript_25886/m.48605 type:complete len:173 (+) Transcript_25886:24-542(+)